ncbi:MAG: glucose-1-phosphate cytidylyltransferase [Candidatus Scalinduaceae bacterium]
MNDVIILCGGKGTRLSEETVGKPKPMVEVGGRPILWHIMKHYSHHGCHRFILALGYKGEYIKNYFYNYRIISRDFTLEMHPQKEPHIHGIGDESHWEIIFIDTGLETLKGGRIKRLEEYVNSDNFHLTYGDGVSNINISDLEQFHLRQGKIGTVTGVHPPSRFGEMVIDGETVTHFEEKPQLSTGIINGGFFIFNKKLFNYLSSDENCDFEFGPLQKIALEGELKVYKYNGFWQCMDTVREKDYLDKLWNSGEAPWKVWSD